MATIRSTLTTENDTIQNNLSRDNTKVKISVCVPTFERVEYLRRLVNSFRSQRYPFTELCLSDDSLSDEIKTFIDTLHDTNIRYERNPKSRGLTFNLQHALTMATGEIAIVLGDDDMLAGEDALDAYADAAEKYPEARFFYSNQIQVDQQDRPSLVYQYFTRTAYFPPGTESVRALWHRSVFIAGMGFRLSNDGAIPRLFPDQLSLFPQVIAVGRLLAQSGSVAIADFVCAVRAHPDQLGGQAAQGKLVTSELERQGGAELVSILRMLTSEHASTFGPIADHLERQIVMNFAGSMHNIRLTAGTPALRHMTSLMLTESKLARQSLWFRTLYIVVLALPKPVLRNTVATLKYLYMVRHRSDLVS